jgi:hypothetical protein
MVRLNNLPFNQAVVLFGFEKKSRDEVQGLTV